jgi:signal transduction histidine kinase
VSNVGPPLPEAMAGQLFESMVSVRPANEGERPRGEPHLGLGLFIVRLIAEYHGGRAVARNRADGRGVTVEVAFPLAGVGPSGA